MIAPEVSFGMEAISTATFAVVANLFFWLLYQYRALEYNQIQPRIEEELNAITERLGQPIDKEPLSAIIGGVISLYRTKSSVIDQKLIKFFSLIGNITLLGMLVGSIANTVQVRDRNFYETLFDSSQAMSNEFLKLGRELDSLNQCYKNMSFFLVGEGDWFHPENTVALCYDAAPTTAANLEHLRKFKAQHIEKFKESLHTRKMLPPPKQ